MIVVKVKKRTAVITALFCLSVILTASLTYSFASTATPPWILNYPLPAGYDWYMGKYNNGTYYAVSGDGQSYYSSSNASDLLMTVINVLTTGGDIFIARNTYTMTNTITDQTRNNIHIISDGALLQFTGSSINGFNLTSVNGWVFDGISLQGTNGGASETKAIDLYTCNYTTIRHCNATNWGYAAFYFNGYNGNGNNGVIDSNYINNCTSTMGQSIWVRSSTGACVTGFEITNNVIENSGGEAVEVSRIANSVISDNYAMCVGGSGGNGYEIAISNNVSLTGNVAYGEPSAKCGLQILDNCDHISAVGNTFITRSTTQAAVDISQSKRVSLVGNVIHGYTNGLVIHNAVNYSSFSGNTMRGDTVWGFVVDHTDSSACDYNTFTGNVVDEYYSQIGTGTGNIGESNIINGLPQVDSGIATNKADGSTIAFSTYSTPTYVGVTSQNSTITLVGYYSLTSSQFTLNLKEIGGGAASGQTVSWIVRWDMF